MLIADGNDLVTDKEAILESWAEHFNSVLNQTSNINEDAIYRHPQIECNVLLDEFHVVMETRKIAQQLSSDKLHVQMQFMSRLIRPGGYPWHRN